MGTKRTVCRTCGAPIAFLQSAKGKWYPVNADSQGNAIMCSGFVQGKGHRATPDFHHCRQSSDERLLQLRAHLAQTLAAQKEANLSGETWYDYSADIARYRQLIADSEGK